MQEGAFLIRIRDGDSIDRDGVKTAELLFTGWSEDCGVTVTGWSEDCGVTVYRVE